MTYGSTHKAYSHTLAIKNIQYCQVISIANIASFFKIEENSYFCTGELA